MISCKSWGKFVHSVWWPSKARASFPRKIPLTLFFWSLSGGSDIPASSGCLPSLCLKIIHTWIGCNDIPGTGLITVRGVKCFCNVVVKHTLEAVEQQSMVCLQPIWHPNKSSGVWPQSFLFSYLCHIYPQCQKSTATNTLCEHLNYWTL